MNGYVKKIYLFIFLFLVSINSFASESIDEEDRFQSGHNYFLAKDYLKCATEMESLKDSIGKFLPQWQSKVQFYRAYCNGTIGYYNHALNLIKEINPAHLTPDENKMLITFQKLMYSKIYNEGFQAYLDEDYLKCATHMESIKDSMTKYSRKWQSKVGFYRAFCNGKIGYETHATNLVKEIDKADLTMRENKSLIFLQKEIQDKIFKIGLQAFLEEDYLTCAVQMESLKDSMGQRTPEWDNSLQFYRAFCNSKLGYRSYAAGLFAEIDKSLLTQKEKDQLAILKESIRAEIRERNKIYLAVYGGSIGYTPKQTKSSASLLGGSATWLPLHGSWDLALSLEKMRLTLNNSLNSYSQTQSNFTLGKKLGELFSIRTFFTNISTSGVGKTGNEGKVFGIMGSRVGSHATSKISKLSFEYDHSIYPRLSVGKTYVQQIVLSWDQTLKTGKSYAITSKLASQTMLPHSELATDPITGFELKSFYERVALDLNLYFTNFQFGISGWGGSEALGVRNLGNLVFNAVEEHRYGFGVNSQINLSPQAAVNLAYSREIFLVKEPSINASTFIAGLTVNF